MDACTTHIHQTEVVTYMSHSLQVGATKIVTAYSVPSESLFTHYDKSLDKTFFF